MQICICARAQIEKISNARTQIEKISNARTQIEKISNARTQIEKISNARAQIEKISNARAQKAQKAHEPPPEDRAKVKDQWQLLGPSASRTAQQEQMA